MKPLSRRTTIVLAVLASLPMSAGSLLAAPKKEDLDKRLTQAREVYQELIQTPDKEVPQALRDRCQCVGIFPHTVKGAIGFGARFGKGLVTCRGESGWSPISFFKLTGGSWGLQLGAESTDLVLFFMTQKSARSLLESKFTLGAKAGVAAGPAGRTAEASTDLKLNAEIYSYARSKGLFAGISLEGARIGADKDDNVAYYGQPVSVEALLFQQQAPTRPESMEALLKILP